MTAAELSEALGIGAVGVRQHLALLERDGLVHASGVRRAVGRPSHLYALTEAAEALFPKAYDHLLIDALEFVRAQGGEHAIAHLFEARRKNACMSSMHRAWKDGHCRSGWQNWRRS